MVSDVNSDSIAAEWIQLEYFNQGHSFMAADSIQARIETEMRKKEELSDFSDFADMYDKC